MELFEGIEIAEEQKTTLQKRFEEQLNNEKKQATINANGILDSVSKTFEDPNTPTEYYIYYKFSKKETKKNNRISYKCDYNYFLLF